MQIYIDNREYTEQCERYKGKVLIIGIDASKTNTGLVVADSNGKVLNYFDINGRSDGTTEVDVLKLCQRQRQFLKVLLQGAKMKHVGIEDIITKKSVGMQEHESRFKITAVFMSFITFFQDNFNITPELINNMAWKAGTLPEEYRKATHKKGSLDYFKDVGSKYAECTDDVTDAICINKYLCIINKVDRRYQIEEPEVARVKGLYNVVSGTRRFGEMREFIYNAEMSIEQNVVVIANKLNPRELAFMFVPTESVSVKTLYLKCTGDFKKKEDVVKIVVSRE